MSLTLPLALCLVCAAVASAKMPIFVDNGRGQTVIDHHLTTREQREMEYEILNLLGLPERPKKLAKTQLKKSAPKFLMNVYHALMEEEEGRVKRDAENNFSGEEQQQIERSDVIMTFESINHQVSNVRHERGNRLWFNVSEVPLAEDVVGAELKIFQNESLVKKTPRNRTYTISVYQLINTDDGERELEYISAVNTTGEFTGWLEVNVSASLSSWVAFPDSNKGLYLSVHPVDKPGREIRPEDIGLVTSKAEDENQPFMVGFLKATNHVKLRRRRRELRTEQNITSELINPSSRTTTTDMTGRSCQIHTLYISFKVLKWQDWIIAPDGYPAYYCAGECNFPLNGHMNATNHAIVQSLVHLMDSRHFPKPCCAPTKLHPISVLYFLDDANVILKKYKKMVVKSCGCH